MRSCEVRAKWAVSQTCRCWLWAKCSYVNVHIVMFQIKSPKIELG